MAIEIICEKCNRVLRDGQWLEDVVPIGRVNKTICPYCQPKPKKDPTPDRGMVYQQMQRAKQMLKRFGL